MTRADILAMAREIVGESLGSASEGSPFAWKLIISHACDQIARKTRCYYGSVSTAVLTNSGLFCSPQMLEINAFTFYGADGKIHPLGSSTIQAMDRDYRTWRSRVPGPVPSTAITVGLNQIILFPVPNFNSLVYTYVDLVLSGNGIVFSSVARPFLQTDVGLYLNVTGGTGFNSGWYQILSVDESGNATVQVSAGTAGSVGGYANFTSGGFWMEGWCVPGASWDDLTDECPLPTIVHMAVAYSAALDRFISLPEAALTQGMIFKRQMLQDKFKSEMDDLETEVRRFTQATREPAYTGGADDGQYAFWDNV